jgi:hypothetical protein
MVGGIVKEKIKRELQKKKIQMARIYPHNG